MRKNLHFCISICFECIVPTYMIIFFRMSKINHLRTHVHTALVWGLLYIYYSFLKYNMLQSFDIHTILNEMWFSINASICKHNDIFEYITANYGKFINDGFMFFANDLCENLWISDKLTVCVGWKSVKALI